MTETYRVIIGEQITKEKSLRDALEYLEKLANLRFISLGLKKVEKKEEDSKEEIIEKPEDEEKVKEELDDMRIVPDQVEEEKPKKLKGWAKYHDDKKNKSFGRGKYPKEMERFVERHLNSNSNQQICDLVSEKFGFEITTPQLGNYMHMRKLKRENPNRQREERKKKMGPPKVWTDEVLKFLKNNIDNFSNKEICEKLKKFNIKTNIANLQGVMSQKGIKRDYQLDVDPKIVDFVNKRKTDDILILRDEIIEKFGVNVPAERLRHLMNNQKKKLHGESVDDKVKRVKRMRDLETFKDDEGIDGMELD